MAHQLFQLPKPTAISANLTLVAGAKVEFFLTGTTTPTPVYQDSGLATPHTNPVEADAAGRLPPIYLDPSIVYKATFTDSADVLIYTADPVNDQLLSQAIIGAHLFPTTAAETSAPITPTSKAYPADMPYYDSRRTGTVGDGSTNDNAAIVSALSQAAAGARVKLPEGKTYNIGSTAIAIPNSVTLDISSTTVNCTGVTAFTFGNGSILIGYDAAISTSGASGAALKKADQATPSNFYIYGWPSLTPTTMGTAGGIGLDFTAAYKGVFEIAIEGYETNVTGGSAATTPQTYYNEFRSLRMRCTSGTTGIKLRNGCNGTILINPQINGGNDATYALHVDASSGTTVIGGYLEGFLVDVATRAVRLNDTDNFTMMGTTLEQGVDATANFAIGVTGTSTQCNFYGIGFAGGWGDSSRIMSWAGSGVYNFIGGAPTNQVCLIGLTTFAGSYLSGETHVGNFYPAAISATVSSAAAIAHTISNSGDGLGLEVSNNSATATAARAALVINRKGGQGCVMAMQNNGTTVAGLFFYSGSPEAALAAPVGSVCMDITNGVQYNKKTGTDANGWKLVTQAA